MNGNIQESIFCVLFPLYFFGGLSGLIVLILYMLFPNLDEFLIKHGFDLGFGIDEEDEKEKLPVVREHKQARRIYANGKFENPNKDYSTEKRELQEV